MTLICAELQTIKLNYVAGKLQACFSSNCNSKLIRDNPLNPRHPRAISKKRKNNELNTTSTLPFLCSQPHQ